MLYRHHSILVDPPPTPEMCYVKNTSGDYLLLKNGVAGISVVVHGHTMRWSGWNKSGKYTAGDETGMVCEADREKLTRWLADFRYEGPNAAKIAHLTFIAAAYRPEYWYFEVNAGRNQS